MTKVFLDEEGYRYIKDDLEELSWGDLQELADYYNVKYQELLEEIQADLQVENSGFTIQFLHQARITVERQDEFDTLLETMNDLYHKK